MDGVLQDLVAGSRLDGAGACSTRKRDGAVRVHVRGRLGSEHMDPTTDICQDDWADGIARCEERGLAQCNA